MNLKALRCCVEIVRQGSFTKAAQHLHIAQPAPSMAVTRLEEELGVSLFNRTTRKVVLTVEGEQFLPRIASALREMDVARQALRDMADLKRGEVRLGIPPMFGLHYVPGLMNAFLAFTMSSFSARGRNEVITAPFLLNVTERRSLESVTSSPFCTADAPDEAGRAAASLISSTV